MLLFIRRREEILHFQTTPSPSPPPKTTPSLSSFPKFLVSFLPASCCLSIPFVLARGEQRLSITIYSDSRSTSGSKPNRAMHTQKRIFARAIMLGRVELQSDTRVTLTVEELSESNHCPLVSRERARLSRFLRALHLDATPCSFLDRGVPFSRQYILDIFIQS